MPQLILKPPLPVLEVLVQPVPNVPPYPLGSYGLEGLPPQLAQRHGSQRLSHDLGHRPALRKSKTWTLGRLALLPTPMQDRMRTFRCAKWAISASFVGTSSIASTSMSHLPPFWCGGSSMSPSLPLLPVYVLTAGSNSSKFGSGAYPPQVIAQHRRLVQAHVRQRHHRVPIETAQRTMSKLKSQRYQVPNRVSTWAALDPTPPSLTTRTDALVIRSMPLLAGDDDDDNNDDDDDNNDNDEYNDNNDDKDEDGNNDEDKDSNNDDDDKDGGEEK